MSDLVVSVSVSKEMYELGQGVAKFLGVMGQALSDGWQSGSDMPSVVGSAIHDLIPAVAGVQDVPAEILEDTESFSKALALSLVDCFVALRKKS
jgi:hypothetical protein